MLSMVKSGRIIVLTVQWVTAVSVKSKCYYKSVWQSNFVQNTNSQVLDFEGYLTLKFKTATHLCCHCHWFEEKELYGFSVSTRSRPVTWVRTSSPIGWTHPHPQLSRGCTRARTVLGTSESGTEITWLFMAFYWNWSWWKTALSAVGINGIKRV